MNKSPKVAPAGGCINQVWYWVAPRSAASSSLTPSFFGMGVDYVVLMLSFNPKLTGLLKASFIHLGAAYAVAVDHGITSFLCELAAVCRSR